MIDTTGFKPVTPNKLSLPTTLCEGDNQEWDAQTRFRSDLA